MARRHATCTRCNEFKRCCPTETLGLCEDCWNVTGQREKDKQSGKLRTPFPFFRLPLEIRRMVYLHVFHTPQPFGIITPDLGHIRRQYGDEYAVQTPMVHNGLLHTCQQAYEEGTTVLYGANVFHFDDDPYGEREFDSGVFRFYMKKRTQLEKLKPLKYYPQDRIYQGEGNRVLHCDLAEMHNWLLSIGESNRLKIRHIRFHFLRDQKRETIGESYWHNIDERKSVHGSHLVEQSLNLIANQHNLETFFLGFEKRPHPHKIRPIISAYDPLLDTVILRRLKASLSCIRGVKKMRCFEIETSQNDLLHYNIIPTTLSGFDEVRNSMQMGYKGRQIHESKYQWQKPSVDQFTGFSDLCDENKIYGSGPKKEPVELFSRPVKRLRGDDSDGLKRLADDDLDESEDESLVPLNLDRRLGYYHVYDRWYGQSQPNTQKV